MTETKTVEAIQADREAAWPFRPEGFGPIDRDAWISGVCDHNQHIQAFARHRLASQSLSTDEEVAEAVAVFQELMTFDLMAKWTREGRQDFRDVMTRAKAAFVALQSKDTPSHGG